MAKCDHCGNDYARAFTVTQEGRTYTFDSFQCAIATMAPACARCGCRIIGQGTEREGATYCSGHCAGG